ncbi:MAG: hypothetical protein K0U93_15820 [Gammaproteobacteria bacterium]|nr:hypothetical protein [Gammaproteobacteria bacterium]
MDWSVLRAPTIFLVLALLVAGGLVAATYSFSDGVEGSHTQESRRLASARGKYLLLDDDKRLVEDFYPRFQALAAGGRIGEERRLNWIETLRQAASAIKLPSLQYQIASRSEATPEFPVDSGNFEVMVSEMTLDIGLLHEGDLFALLDELERRATGLFHVSDCRMERVTPDVQEEEPGQANLRAVCTIDWYTLVPKETDDAVSRRRRA